MYSFWDKLNHLVPEPQCNTTEDVIDLWYDDRDQPTYEEIAAVTDEEISLKIKEGAFDLEVAQLSPVLRAMFDQFDEDNPNFKAKTKIKFDQRP